MNRAHTNSRCRPTHGLPVHRAPGLPDGPLVERRDRRHDDFPSRVDRVGGLVGWIFVVGVIAGVMYL